MIGGVFLVGSDRKAMAEGRRSTRNVWVSPSTDKTTTFRVTDKPDYKINAKSKKYRIKSFGVVTWEGWVKWSKATISPSGKTASILGSPLQLHEERKAKELYLYAKMHGTFEPLVGKGEKVKELDFDIRTDKVAIDVDAVATYNTLTHAGTVFVLGDVRPVPGFVRWFERATRINGTRNVSGPSTFFMSSAGAPLPRTPRGMAHVNVSYDPLDARYHPGWVIKRSRWVIGP